MKRLTSRIISFIALSLAPVAASAATLTVTPNVISNSYAGAITLQIGGLNTGEEILVEQFTDFDSDGTPESRDMTLAAFPLVDNQCTIAGGVTNLHVPGDLGGTSGSITARIQMPVVSFQRRMVGKHVFRVSSPTTRFSAVSAPFTITNAMYGGQVSGLINSAGTNVPYAMVVLFQLSGGDSVNPVAACAADGTGNYSIKAPPAAYMVAAFKNNYLANFADPTVAVIPQTGTVNANVTLIAGSRTISGRVSDLANSLQGLGGLLMVAESETGQIGVGFTDKTGNYTVGVTPAVFQVGPDGVDLNGLGYLGLENWPSADCTGGNATGVSVSAPKGTALIYGTVKTEAGTPLAGVSLWGGNWPEFGSASPRTDLSGAYFSAVTPGTWQLSIDREDNSAYPGYVFSSRAENIIIAVSNVAIRRDFTAKSAPYIITGYLRDPAMAPVAGIRIWGTATNNGVEYKSEGMTDESGFFSMGAFNGVWSVVASCEDDEGLRARGFGCMSGELITVANNNANVNLTAIPCSGLQIETVSLPDGRVNESYSTVMAAQNCGGWLNWSLAPGSGPLPPGLNLMNNGQLTGTPTQAGQFSFTVQANDGTSTATKGLTLAIVNSMPLGIFSGNPFNGTNGVVYSFHLEAVGGQPPYNWTLAPGSGPLPGGLSLTTGGDITGTPNLAGDFFFRVRVTDTAQANVEQTFRLIVYPVVAPLDIVTTSLPKGTSNVPYSFSLQGTGGQPPYWWNMALGSAPLPPGLSLGNNSGVIQGTPTTAGTYQFIIHLQDSGSMMTSTDEQLLSITIQAGTPWSMGTPAIGTNGRFQFQINGTQGMAYTVETTTDLQTWTSAGSGNAPSNSFIFVADPPSASMRFYRVRTGP